MAAAVAPDASASDGSVPARVQPFSFESVPVRVFEYRGGAVTLLHEASPLTVVHDGRLLRLYAQGQPLAALHPGTQCFRDNKSFMFPMENSADWLTIVLPDETPESALAALIKAITTTCVLLDGCVSGDWSVRVVETIQTATVALAGTIATTTRHATAAIDWSSEALRGYLGRNREPTKISPVVKGTASAVCIVARTASSVVTTVVGSAAAVGARLLPRPDPSSQSSVTRIASVGIRSGAQLWSQLSDAVTTVSGAALREATQTVRHKYGDDAASVAESAAGTVAAVRAMATAVRPSSVVKGSIAHAMAPKP